MEGVRPARLWSSGLARRGRRRCSQAADGTDAPVFDGGPIWFYMAVTATGLTATAVFLLMARGSRLRAH